jgi:hypothetical protein
MWAAMASTGTPLSLTVKQPIDKMEVSRPAATCTHGEPANEMCLGKLGAHRLAQRIG